MNNDTSAFDAARLLGVGTAGQLSSTHVAPVAAQPGDSIDPAYRAKATEAAVKFESYFIGQMLHQMRAGVRAVASDDSASKSQNQDMLDMADNMVADQLAGKRAFGVADAILRQLLPNTAAPTVASSGLPSQQAAAKVADPQILQTPLNPEQ